MGEEQIITQMGLLLTQVRYARRALEDLERNVANYGGLSFLQRMAPAEAFGAPPLLNGALKVHLVNITDLTSGGSSFFESLLGGIGRFFGGLVGGVAGGTIASVRLPGMIANVAHIADVLDRIVARTGFRFNQGPQDDANPNPEGGSWLDGLPPLTDALLGFAALFRAASGEPGASGPSQVQTAALEQLERFLRPIYAILDATARVVNGLILLLPIATGAFAWLIAQIDVLKLALLEFLQFLLRNLFLLAGVVLVTLSETLAAAARLGQGLLRIVGSFLGDVLHALFNLLARVVEVALHTFRFVADGLAATVDPLLDWAVARVFHALNALSQTPVFRVVYHIVDILPNILPALVRLVHGVGLTGYERRRLGGIGRLPALTTTPPPAPPPGPRAPDLARAFRPSPALRRLERDYRSLGVGMRNTVDYFFRRSQRALGQVGGLLEDDRFADQLQTRLGQVQRRAGELGQAMEPALTAAQRPRTGLDVIAEAYEQWVRGGGLTAVLGAINQHFRNEPAVAQRIVAQTAMERARATVEIAEVVVEVEAPAARRDGDAASLLPEPALIDQVVEALRDRLERGAQPGFDAFGFA